MTAAIDAALTDALADAVGASFRAEVARAKRSLADCKALIASLEAQIAALEAGVAERKREADVTAAQAPQARKGK